MEGSPCDERRRHLEAEPVLMQQVLEEPVHQFQLDDPASHHFPALLEVTHQSLAISNLITYAASLGDSDEELECQGVSSDCERRREFEDFRLQVLSKQQQLNGSNAGCTAGIPATSSVDASKGPWISSQSTTASDSISRPTSPAIDEDSQSVYSV
jgi:hypothetical protein